MKILIACEYSGVVRDEFQAAGHDATSCDLRPTETIGSHYQGDVMDIIDEPWDMLIAHPYCTFNTLSGIQWMYHPDDTYLPAELRRRHPRYPNRMDDFLKGVDFFNKLKNCNIPKKCLENSQPHGLAMRHIGRYTQLVQPWMFGSPFTKGAALWLEGLPELVPTHEKQDYEIIIPACHMMAPGPDREKERSRTDPAIAKAMVKAWSDL